ncbi:MAG: prepilin-type N-terminal cleavage/methylation domain-containing protein [Sedimentisphaerales bacterium]|nr:prepilin-type N-terminal cleavage/methylation domain-containing protein [Sedimentisphaerales bacterium]
MRNNGFTLVEALFAIVLVGLAVASLVGANAAFTRANGVGADLSTAEFLLEQIKELTATLPVIDPETETTTFGPEEGSVAGYDDLDDFDGASFSPPISAGRVSLSDFGSFTQQVTVENVNPSDFEAVAADHSSSFVRLTVTVLRGGVQISRASWIRARY